MQRTNRPGAAWGVNAPRRVHRGNRSLVLPFAASLLLCLAALQAQAPTATEPPSSFEFGTAIQGTPVTHVFVLRNPSATPLRILGVSLSPGLRISGFPAQVGPNHQIDLPVSFSTSGMRGPYSGELRLRLDDPGRPEAVFTMAGVVVPPIEFRPYAAFFVTGDRRTPARASIEIVNHQEAPLRITRLEYPSERFDARVESVEEGRRYRLSITLPTDAAAGVREDVIQLHADDGRILRVAANTRLRERVYTFPADVDLGTIPYELLDDDGGDVPAQTLMVYQVGGADFQARFTTGIKGLAIAAERGPKGDRWQATVTLERSAAAAGPIQGSIVIETNDPEFPRLVVPVKGFVRGFRGASLAGSPREPRVRATLEGDLPHD
jgi:hypothetical protein